jgi:type IV pilus assembly protein PilW
VTARHPKRPVRQQGFTLVELMVGLLIGLFLMGGLLIVVQDNKRTFSSQNGLARLQDDERLAMTLLTDVIQQTGYYPSPTLNTAASMFPVTGAYAKAGQPMFGTHTSTTAADTLQARYATKGGDGVLDCGGQAKAVPWVFNSQFSVVGGQLVCTTEGGTVYTLVGDVSTAGAVQDAVSIENMQFLYGVNAAGTGTNVDTYKTADLMTPADWNNVISVQITLKFSNPLYSTTNQGQGSTMLPTIQFSRVVNIMRQTGV